VECQCVYDQKVISVATRVL